MTETATITATEPTALPADTSQEATRVAGTGPEAQTTTLPQTRDVIIKVPLHVTDQQVDMAISMGSIAVEAIAHGGLIMFFPQSIRAENGERRQAIGHARMPILNGSDVQRVVRLVSVIGTENTKVLEAQSRGVSGDHLTTAISAENTKDNATRDLTAQAQGHAGGIIIAQ